MLEEKTVFRLNRLASGALVGTLISMIFFYLTGTIAATLRAQTNILMWKCAVFSSLICGLSLLLLRKDFKRLRTALTPRAFSVLLESILVSLVSLVLLYNLALHGFVSGNGGDGGNHLRMAHEVLYGHCNDHDIFYAQFGFVYLADVLFRVGEYGGFKLSFYYTIFLLILLISMGTATLEFESRWFIRALRWLFFLLLSLPLLHYLQIDGFYWHYFSIVPLALGAWGYIASESRFRRIGFWGLTCVFLRYTYPLNLPDALIVLALILVTEGRTWKFRALAALTTLFSAYAYKLILDTGSTPGGLLKPSLFNLAGALIIGSTVFLLARQQEAPRSSATLSDVRRRFYFISSRFLLLIGILSFVLWISDYPKVYYAFKYPMVPCILMAALLTLIAPRIFALQKRWMGIIGLCACVLYMGTDVYYDSYFDRFMTHQKFFEVNVLLDEEASQRIQSVLVERHRPFKVFLSQHWPELSTTNAFFGLGFESVDEAWLRIIAPGPGCIFYRATERGELQYSSLGRRSRKWISYFENRVNSHSDRSCFDLPVRWYVGEENVQSRKICYVCD